MWAIILLTDAVNLKPLTASAFGNLHGFISRVHVGRDSCSRTPMSK